MGTFWYHLQGKLQAHKGVGEYSPEALVPKVFKLYTLMLVMLVRNQDNSSMNYLCILI